MFDDRDFPPLGVGLEFEMDSRLVRPPEDRRILGRINVPALFDYVEVQPPHVIIEPTLLDAFAPTRTTVHVSNLSIGSVDIPMDAEYLKLACRLWRDTDTPWANEHMSWNRFDGGDTQHFVLPVLGRDVRDTIIANALRLGELSGLPIVLENAPRTVVVDLPGNLTESEFAASILDGAGAGFVLDIENGRATAMARGISFADYLRELPLSRTIEIHVADPLADRALLDTILDVAPVRAITLHWEYITRANEDDVMGLIAHFRDRIGVGGRSLKCPSAPLSPDTALSLAPGVTATIRNDAIRVSGGLAGHRLDLPLESLPTVAQFTSPQSIVRVLEEMGDGPAELGAATATVRQLLDISALAPADTPAVPKTWDSWDVALDFYLGTRTRADTSFATLAELEEGLESKAREEQQPSAYKDYWAHPFLPLPNPLLDEPHRNSDFIDVLLRRRSTRSFADIPLDADRLSALLYYVWGATSVERNPYGDVFLRKTSPSGGSLHPTEVYPLLMNVDGFEPGLYHYSVRRHGLVLLSRDDPRAWIGSACGGQDWVADAAAVFVSTCVIARPAWKYQFSRAFRAMLLEAGHIGQSFALTATHFDLAPFTTIALRDPMFEQRLCLDPLVEPIMLLTGVGMPDPGNERPDRPRQR